MRSSRKKPNVILKRDGEFTQTIGKTASSKPNPLSSLAQELRGKLDAARPTEPADVQPEAVAVVEQGRGPEPAAPHDPPIAEQPSPKQPPEVQTPTAPRQASREAAGTATVEHDAETAPGRGPHGSAPPPPEKEPDAGRAGATDAGVDVTLTIRIPSDLERRAESWAAAVGLPPVTLLRNSLNRFKPKLMGQFKTVKAGEVDLDRAESVGRHMQTRVRFTSAEYAKMEARLDPAGFDVLRSILNHYARARFSDFLDELMTNAGY
tara:strand:+ start:215 stop:1006 length:792 start_codon:yes stop_codon:yes gene_type:complete